MSMFQRKIYDKLLEWKNESDGKTALLIEGARRIGKSTVAEAFAKEAYKSYKIYIQNELEKKALLSSKSDWSMLESLVQKCNDNPNLRITVYLNDNTRIDMKTYDVHKTITSSLIDGNEYYEEVK